MFRYLILGLLRDGCHRHGYALMKECQCRSGMRISTGNFYRELKRLAAAGMVRFAANPEGADPRRAPYEITEIGKLAFDEWFCGQRASTIGEYDDELSTRAMFIGEADPAVGRRVLEEWREELWIRSKHLEKEQHAALLRHAARNGQPFGALPVLVARRLKHISADLGFLDELRSAFEEWLAPPRVELCSNAGRRSLERRTSRGLRESAGKRSPSAARTNGSKA